VVLPEDELLFTMRDPRGLYSSDMIADIIKLAHQQGFPVCAGSYLAWMNVAQLDALVHGRYDA
jgi:hypothetical protein